MQGAEGKSALKLSLLHTAPIPEFSFSNFFFDFSLFIFPFCPSPGGYAAVIPGPGASSSSGSLRSRVPWELGGAKGSGT